MKYNEPNIKIQITKLILIELHSYLQGAVISGFSNENNFSRLHPEREALIFYSINTAREKTAAALFKCFNDILTKKMKINLSKAERIALSILFKRVTPPICLLQAEFMIINGLNYSENRAQIH